MGILALAADERVVELDTAVEKLVKAAEAGPDKAGK